MKKENRVEPAFQENNIPVVFSANEVFVPVLAVMLQSIIENASAEHNYDIIILTRDISGAYTTRLQNMVGDRSNFSLRVVDISEFVAGYDFYTENRADITAETYFRLLMPDLLTAYEKAIYLDGDMVANADVAELYDVDLTDFLLASSLDADGVGRCHKPGGDPRKDYREQILKLKDPDKYFCAGMLVVNLEKFRAELPTEKLLKTAVSRQWQFHDQDVLNVLCEGKVKLLPMAWNVLRDAGNNQYLPGDFYREFLASEKDPKIIHYGGMRKPWRHFDVERGEYFWRYAGKTPFYREILSLVRDTNESRYAAYLSRGTLETEQAKEVVLEQFRQGQIGLRYVFRYVKAWLGYKLHGGTKTA